MTSLPPPPPPTLPPTMEDSTTTSPTKYFSGNNILSDKVNRALQVRTDTPAMKAALEALANLAPPPTSMSTTTSLLSSTKSLDARSVRVAIEQDALHQGKLLQEELERLVKSVQTMRTSIQDVARVAQEEVEESLTQRVIVMNTGLELKGNTEEADEEKDDVASSLDYYGKDDVFHEEERLAALLADAFQERHEANERFSNISEFLEKFNVNERDSRLLDHYDFEDAMDEPVGDGMEFLQALERVTKIRKELQTYFQGDASNSTETATSKLGLSSAMRMMDSLSTKQEQAFERLYRFLHSRLDLTSVNVSHVPTSSSSQAAPPQPVFMDDDDGMDETLGKEFIRKSLVLLRQVPAYYSHTLELIATRRRSEVTRKFLLALTSGYNGGPPMVHQMTWMAWHVFPQRMC